MSESDDDDFEESKVHQNKINGDTKPMSEIASEFEKPMSEIQSEFEDESDEDEEELEQDDENDWIIPVTIRNDEPTNGTETSIIVDPN
tara:strand:- start:52 stop:315 length:264 start_codon:yes stop_codon:yes gene_type:complete